jgi:hypothetical protein
MWVLTNPSLPSWINAITVVVLAIITFFYARSAKRQAEAAEAQARASTKQADVAERQLAILQSQIAEQAGTALAVLKENVGELRQTANHWFQTMTLWGQLTPHPGIDILPTRWLASVEYARRLSPELYGQLVEIQKLSKKASLDIDQFTGKTSGNRSETEASQIKQLLIQIVNACETVSNKLRS